MEISRKLDIRFDDFGRRHVGTGDIELFDCLRRRNQAEAREYQQACWLIRDGIHLCNSIDDFLDLHQDNERLTLIGKAAVAKCILDAENSSLLHYDSDNRHAGMNFVNLHNTWFTKFMKMLARGVPVQKAESIFTNVSFIVFNYDRCLEHFLLHAVQRLYGMTEQDAAPICAKLVIKHPYGVLAPLATKISRVGVKYGDNKHTDCADLAVNIKTYTEQIEEGDELVEIRSLVEEAERLIFLGFAFHEQNMRLIAPPIPTKPKPVYATAFGMSDDDAEASRLQIASLFKNSERGMIRLQNKLTSGDLFDNYSKSLAS